jgi:two-component system, LuxR family, response regulator FixJ
MPRRDARIMVKRAALPMSGPATLLVIDDDEAIRDSLSALLEAAGHRAETRSSSADLRARGIPPGTAGLLLDVRLGEGDDGIELMAELKANGLAVPIVVITGHGDVPLAVRAMRLGAFHFLEKPFTADILLDVVADALNAAAPAADAAARMALLTAREREVVDGLVAGKQNKVVAADLGISVRTVEAYRATVMSKLGLRSFADLVRIALAAGSP